MARDREPWSQAGLIEALFDAFDGYLKSQGYQAMGGQIIEASLVAVPIQRYRRDENKRIQRGELPEAGSDEAAKPRQKDTELDEAARQVASGRTAPSGRKRWKRR